jgi:hypothetical protein
MKWGLSMRWRSACLTSAAAVLVLVFASGASAAAANPGYDISYPQCGGSYPASPAFGVVGVNGGLANDPNECLSSELAWAKASPGLTTPSQAPASLYINTADPGPAPGVTDWPKSGDAGSYGTCDGSWSRACAYVYGQQRATYSYGLVNAIDPNLASTAPWWLDIETSNSWATSSTAGFAGLNIAAIHGFIDGLTSAGAAAPIGIYSTGSQWNAITGLTAQTTASAFGSSLPAWVPGARTLKQAQTKCASTAFTGAKPTLAQYRKNGFDADLRCG